MTSKKCVRLNLMTTSNSQENWTWNLILVSLWWYINIWYFVITSDRYHRALFTVKGVWLKKKKNKYIWIFTFVLYHKIIDSLYGTQPFTHFYLKQYTTNEEMDMPRALIVLRAILQLLELPFCDLLTWKWSFSYLKWLFSNWGEQF